MTRDAVNDITTLASAFSGLANSTMNLFDARVKAEETRLSVQLNNSMTNFLERFDLPAGHPDKIDTDNWDDELQKYQSGIDGALGSVKSDPIRSAVTATFTGQMNQFRLAVSDKMGAAVAAESKGNFVSALSEAKNAPGSYENRAALYADVLSKIPKKLFTPEQMDIINADYRALAGGIVSESMLSKQLAAHNELKVAASAARITPEADPMSDPFLVVNERVRAASEAAALDKAIDQNNPYDNARRALLARDDLPVDVKGQAMSLMNGQLAAMDKDATGQTATMKKLVESGDMTFSSAVSRLFDMPQTNDSKAANFAELSSANDIDYKRKMSLVAEAWEARYGTIGGSNEASKDSIKMIQEIGKNLKGKDAVGFIDEQSNRINVFREGVKTPADLAKQELSNILALYDAEEISGMERVVRTLNLEDPDVRLAAYKEIRGSSDKTLTDAFKLRSIADNDLKLLKSIAYSVIPVNKDFAGLLSKVATDPKKVTNKETAKVLEYLSALEVAVNDAKSRDMKMTTDQQNKFAVNWAVNAAKDAAYLGWTLPPGSGDLKGMKKVMHPWVAHGDKPNGENRADVFSMDLYNTVHGIDTTFTEAQAGEAQLLRMMIEDSKKQIPINGDTKKPYEISDMAPVNIMGNMYIQTSDGKHVIGIDAGKKDDGSEDKLVFFDMTKGSNKDNYDAKLTKTAEIAKTDSQVSADQAAADKAAAAKAAAAKAAADKDAADAIWNFNMSVAFGDNSDKELKAAVERAIAEGARPEDITAKGYDPTTGKKVKK